jgi:hypothetical protein
MTLDEFAETLRSFGPIIREADDYRPLAKHIRDLLVRQREACALAICEKVPHSACGDMFCPADLARKAKLVCES